MTTVSRPSDPALLRLLSAHRDVVLSSVTSGGELSIEQDGWKRSLAVGDAACEAAGLVELMDNNPLVCADRASVPGPVATLALIALGPLVHAGLLMEEPVMQVAGCGEDASVDGFLRREGWEGGALVSYGSEELGGVVAANVVAMVPGTVPQPVVEDLFRERYSHCFYVRECGDEEWDVSLVAGKPWACYRLSRSGNELLTVQAMADRDGKCGAAQVVHMMNVMCGFEECEGVGKE